MAALTLDVLFRSLKKGARISEPVYLLYGDEDVLKDEHGNALSPFSRNKSTVQLAV